MSSTYTFRTRTKKDWRKLCYGNQLPRMQKTEPRKVAVLPGNYQIERIISKRTIQGQVRTYSMEERHRKILQASFVFLTKNIHNVDNVCDNLMADEVLTTGMVDTIKHKRPRPTAQVRELISILPRRGKKAYESFIQALTISENQDSADFLRSKEGSHGEKGDNSKKQEDKLKKEDEVPEDWPSIKGISLVQKKEIKKTLEENLTKISESRKVYYMTGKNKGKVIVISNVPEESLLRGCKKTCGNDSKCESSTTTECEENCIARCRNNVDFDSSSIQQLFKYMKFESKVMLKNQTGEELKTSLRKELEVGDDEDYNSVVVVIMSGGMEYEPGQIYDKNGTKVPREDILQIIWEAEAFKGKPKIVIIRTYSFAEVTKSFDTLDADKTSSILNSDPNKDDMFVVSSIPQTKVGPWVVGENICGSYFIQALIHVFKNMAHEKSFLQLMEQVNDHLHNALVPETVSGEKKYSKKNVSEAVVLEHSVDKELFLFPCLCGFGEISVKAQVEPTEPKPVQETEVKAEESQNKSAEWPNLKKPGCNFSKKNLKKSDKEIFSNIMKEGKETYSMTGTDKGKFILISNVACPTVCTHPDTEQTENVIRENERRSKCRNNIDFDNTNIGLVLKVIGWKGGLQIKNKESQEIIKSLTSQLDEIDKDAEADAEVNFDSLVVIILSGKIDGEAAKIYDKDGNIVPKEKIQQIIKESKHFKGKPKIVFIQTYNFQEISPCDELDAANNEIIMGNDPNSDDLFVVSSYPRIEKGPWMIGDHMCGSYFIQALIHIFTNHAYNKSFLDLMGELQKCLVNAVVPEMTKDGKNKDNGGRKHVADVVLLEHSKQKELYLFPGFTQPKVENIDLGASLRGGPVCQPSA